MGTRALVGCTGFVGSNLVRQAEFDIAVHRPDLDRLANERFDILVCAGAPAEKWLANAKPDDDRRNLERLVDGLSTATADLMVLISTIDVYPVTKGVDEQTTVDPDAGTPYGRHRYWLEEQCRALFTRTLVVRLPGLFGPGLKKNFLFDMANRRNLSLTHAESRFQYYDVRRLWADVLTTVEAALDLVNLVTPPLTASQAARIGFGMNFDHETEAPPITYDVQTCHSAIFGGPLGYVYDAREAAVRLSDWGGVEYRASGGAS